MTQPDPVAAHTVLSCPSVRRPSWWAQWSAKLGLAVLLALGGSGVLQVVTPPPAAEAYTSRLNLFLVREDWESFDAFLQRAEIIARAGVQRSFDSDVLMTDVVVNVIGENQGVSMPVMTVSVSRRDWQLQPDVTAWADYYDAARTLLR